MARLHLIGLFHTIANSDYSHCAFTGRVLRFGKMMLPFGHEVVEYSNEGSEAESSEYVPILTRDKFLDLRKMSETESPGIPHSIDTTMYREFSERLKIELFERVKPGDIICHPFGIAHQDLGKLFPQAHHLEIGIGYPDCAFPLRVYETYHWLSWHHGKEQTPGNAYEWVCPMGHDIDLWKVQEKPGDYLLYFGRITESKGLYTVREIAKHVDMPVIICGEGDPRPFLSPDIPNLEYLPPVTGTDRSDLIGGAYAMLCPTTYIEPLCNSGIEAQLCGTPVLCSDYGAFREIMIHGETGYRCHTLGDYLAAINSVEELNRARIAERARSIYNLETVGEQMHQIIKQVETLNGPGWFDQSPINAVWSHI